MVVAIRERGIKMKRSEINQAIEDAKAIMERYNFLLPPFAYYTQDMWKNLDLDKEQELVDGMLGWDITDFNQGDFANFGLTLFTLRNNTSTNNKPYAEKIMLVKQNQMTPMHYHWQKMEDIINRGGGNLIVKLYARDEKNDELDLINPVMVKVDGKELLLQPGSEICIKPGQSVCLTQFVYHSFWAEDGSGDVLAGEVSMANDDDNDNRFLQSLGRFSNIEEDEPAQHLLCNEYNKFIK